MKHGHFEDVLYFKDLTTDEDGIRLVLTRPLEYIGAEGTLRVVPEGFVTNLASSPRIAWRIVPPWGSGNRAYVLHDWEYTIQRMSRLEADKLLLEAQYACDVATWKANLVYSAVRVGGFKAWNDVLPQQIQEAREANSKGRYTRRIL